LDVSNNICFYPAPYIVTYFNSNSTCYIIWLIMIWTKENITEYMKEKQLYICYKKESKAWRTLAQNRTFWKIFKGIWDKLWYKKEVVRTNILTALFWTYEVYMFWERHLIPNKVSTTELSKEEWIQVIDWALEYAKKIDAWIEITSAEVTNLYESYN
jgi:hypothetical protein